MKKRTYIGVSTTFHDPAVAVLNDQGDVLFAEAAERYLQYKRAPFCEPAPLLYLPEILKDHVGPGHEIVVATSWGEQFTQYLERFSTSGFFTFDSVRTLEKKMTRSLVDSHNERALLSELHIGQQRAGHSVLIATERTFGHSNLELRRFNHHETHAAYGCFTSQFDEAACLVVDGLGGTAASAIFEFRDGKLDRKKQFTGRESIGFYFGLITELCGWDPAKGEEWKVMGLAPYGKEDGELRTMINRLWRVESGRIRASTEEEIASAIHDIKAYVANGDDQTQANLALEGQLGFERLMQNQIEATKSLVDSENLVLVGGCALNSTFNGKINSDASPTDVLFKNLFVPSAPADDGNAIGAAMLALEQDNPGASNQKRLLSPYLGKDLSAAKLDRIANGEPRVKHLGESVSKFAAERLADGKLVGWVQGRSEFGPRALGNRSILADARPEGAKDAINAKVKYREAFRPFAPSILHEHGPDWFEQYQNTPYMERTLHFKEAVKGQVPAVVHADGTGRLQSVSKELNGRYYDLISHFHALTGVPLILNTSFNIMGKPILHSAEDALLMFYTTGIDVLVVGDYALEK
ncbi:MAG: carbamoyltransferase C-terminal domain-containing protein [Pseudomonadota bacterium]